MSLPRGVLLILRLMLRQPAHTLPSGCVPVLLQVRPPQSLRQHLTGLSRKKEEAVQDALEEDADSLDEQLKDANGFLKSLFCVLVQLRSGQRRGVTLQAITHLQELLK